MDADTSMQDAPTGETPPLRPLTNRERYFKWRYEQAVDAFRQREMSKVQDVAEELLLQPELPLLYRAALSFYLAGMAIYQDINTSKEDATVLLKDCLHYCEIVIRGANEWEDPSATEELQRQARTALKQFLEDGSQSIDEGIEEIPDGGNGDIPAHSAESGLATPTPSQLTRLAIRPSAKLPTPAVSSAASTPSTSDFAQKAAAQMPMSPIEEQEEGAAKGNK